MSISVEPKVKLQDVEKLQYHIREIRKTLSKYPMATGFSSMATTMERAKRGAVDLEKWINCLDVGEKDV